MADSASQSVKLPVEAEPQNSLTKKFTEKDWTAVKALRVECSACSASFIDSSVIDYYPHYSDILPLTLTYRQLYRSFSKKPFRMTLMRD